MHNACDARTHNARHYNTYVLRATIALIPHVTRTLRAADVRHTQPLRFPKPCTHYARSVRGTQVSVQRGENKLSQQIYIRRARTRPGRHLGKYRYANMGVGWGGGWYFGVLGHEFTYYQVWVSPVQSDRFKARCRVFHNSCI